MFLGSDDPIEHVTDYYLLTWGGVPVLTMQMVTMLFVTGLFLLTMVRAARSIATGPESQGNERYLTKGRLGQIVEAVIVYLRDEMLVPVLGKHHTRRYLPYLLTLFFFILFNNVFGLIPVLDILRLLGVNEQVIGGTPTANIMVTGALALLSFIVIELHGMRELGLKGWLLHNCGGLVPGPVYLLPIAALVFVVELAGHFIKPTALAIRLFANMFAGHTLMAVLLGFGAAAAKGSMGLVGVGAVTAVSGLAAVLITFLELFVAFLQAFIFMFLTAVFISLMSHHDEEHEHKKEEHGHGTAPEPAPA